MPLKADALAVEVIDGAVLGSIGVLLASPGLEIPVFRSGVPSPSMSPISCPFVDPSPSESNAANAADQNCC